MPRWLRLHVEEPYFVALRGKSGPSPDLQVRVNKVNEPRKDDRVTSSSLPKSPPNSEYNKSVFERLIPHRADA